MTLKRKTTGISVVLVAVTTAWVVLRHANAADTPAEPTAAETPSVPVQTTQLHAGRISQTASAYGVIQARAQQAIALTAKYDSIITGVHVALGEAVTADAQLFDITPTPEAQLALTQAEEAAQAAERNLEQVKHRRDDQLATNADVTTAEQAREVARTQLNAMKARGIGSSKSLTASGAGVISQLSAQPGQTVTAGTVLALITPQNGLEAKIGLDPTIAPLLAAGAAVDLHDVVSDAELLHATLRNVGHSIDPQTRRVDAFITPPADSPLLAGAFVEAKFVVKTVDGLIAPRAATLQEDDQWTLYTVHDGKAVKHVIKLGLAQDDDVVVSADDIKAGDIIITARNGEVTDGTPITVEAPATQPATGTKGAE
ncbi:MAG: acrA 4 [Phycisphaerales bacterium]|nr:acrA 4 [Phycisphaerales bacterium]